MTGQLKYYLRTVSGIRLVKVKFDVDEQEGVGMGTCEVEGEGSMPVELTDKVLTEIVLLCKREATRKLFIKSAKGYPFGIN